MTRDIPAMPVKVTVYAAVRYDKPVAELAFADVAGEVMTLQLSPIVVLNLLVQLATFIDQIGIEV